MILSFRRSRFAVLIAFVGCISLLTLYGILKNLYQLRNLLSYSTRPLWDKNSAPNEVLPHFYGEGLKMDEHVCTLHGFTKRDEKASIKILDAVLMSNELDLLEIRLHELDPVVDYFLILESNASFTGLPKETFFANNRAQFAEFEHKIVYRFLPGYPLQPSQSAWDVEANTRNTMTDLISSHISTFPSDIQSIVFMSDLDEIPARHTVDLLKSCDFGHSIHLQLRDYLYSFEWYIGPSSWRASAHVWDRVTSYYRHSKSGERILADSGWHCSYCFKTIPEYILKMKGYSHADRIAGRVNLLDPKRIQDTICKGKDIFDMLPEAYSYLDLLSQMSLRPLKTAVGLPRYLIENSDKYRFLLPGGCKRDL